MILQTRRGLPINVDQVRINKWKLNRIQTRCGLPIAVDKVSVNEQKSDRYLENLQIQNWYGLMNEEYVWHGLMNKNQIDALNIDQVKVANRCRLSMG